MYDVFRAEATPMRRAMKSSVARLTAFVVIGFMGFLAASCGGRKTSNISANASDVSIQKRIVQLLAAAKDHDSREKGRDALTALDELLRLDPNNSQALVLRDKIDAYYGFHEMTNSIGMTLIEIKPGEFLMGSPPNEEGHDADETLHRVKITRPFMLGTCLVTRRQFAAFVRDSGYQSEGEKAGSAFAIDGNKIGEIKGASWKNPGFEQTDDHPVVCVSWHDAQAFCQWLSKKEGKTYHLPTEAQWEYACRAGSQGAYFWGNNPDDGKGWINCADLAIKQKFPNANPIFNWSDGFVFTSPVGFFKPNAWGLYDMIGNAFEWCNDYYGPYPAGDAVDPTGPPQGDADSPRVLRGGSWSDPPHFCRAACRIRRPPRGRSFNFGFRCLMEIP